MVLAIDPSLTSTGVVLGSRKPTIDLWKPGERRGPERLKWFFNRTTKIISHWEPAVVAIEGYAYRAKDSHAHSLGELGGVIRLACARTSTPLLVVPPGNIKKFATGKGNANKQLVLTEAVRRLDYEGHSDDEADALWLWHLAQAWLNDGTPLDGVKLPALHLKALDEIDKGLWKP